ncbi:MAG: hypothetical protein M1816_000634 [Peltula sp. TS41687]|nr:MAG: hypothetical protein M1816_000634 [Peltula sp. TS41687]
MAQFFPTSAPYSNAQQQQQNLQFYPSSYPVPVSGHSTPSQAYGGPISSSSSTSAYATQSNLGFGGGVGGGGISGPAGGVSGRMGVGQGGLRTGWLAAFGTEGYDGEPPLLEELGVNFGHIKVKTLTVLNPFARIDQHIMDDSDLAGPVLFFLLFGTFLLFVCYCLLPLVLTSLIGVVMPMDAPLGYVLTIAAIIWCTYSSSGMFCAVGRMRGMRGLVAYPLALFYVGFGIMGIFSSRGRGVLEKVTSGGTVGGPVGLGGVGGAKGV